MKMIKIGNLLICLLCLICKSQAQNFIVSNLDQAQSSTTRANTQLWRAIATSFTTGSQATTIAGAVTRVGEFDSGGDEFVSIYNNSASNAPSTEFASFQDNPRDLGSNDRFEFALDSAVELSANTTYWMVYGVNGDADFQVYFTNSADQTGNDEWSIGDSIFYLNRSTGTWSEFPGVQPIQFGIPSTIIPEPDDYAFVAGLLLIALVAFRRNQFAHQT